jgi:hypothetical protein
MTAGLILLAALAADPMPDASIARMKKDIFYLASEELRGRNTGSPEIEKAAEYIAAAFKEAGLQPAKPGGDYFQNYEFTYGSAKLGTPNSFKYSLAGGGDANLKFAGAFSPVGLSANGKVTGKAAFAGYGLQVEKLNYDDYAKLDVKGKIVFMLRKTPKAEQKDNPFDKDEFRDAAALMTKLNTAKKLGAAAVVFVNDRTYGADGDTLLEFRRNLFDTTQSMPVLMVKRHVLAAILDDAGKSLDQLEAQMDKELKPRTVDLPNCTITAEVTVNRPEIKAKNVIGVSPGAGPLAEETVVIGAHFDHVGLNEHSNSLAGQAGKGKIHFGADDNASGTTGLIEVARRIGAMKDRQGRRIVFIAFSGEELGLYGSKHYCKEPLFPLEKTAFMINMDMIGRSVPVGEEGAAKKDRLVVYGLGTTPGLEQLVDDANKKYDFKLFKIPGGTGPSDHDSFYRKKVPVLFFFTGTHKDYHRPTDTPDKINLPVMKKIADMAEGFLVHFATVPEKPKYLVTQGGWEDPTEERPRSTNRNANMPKLGIMPGNYEEEDKGVLVEEVTPGGAAEKGGLKAGDLIVEIAGKPVKNINNYLTLMAAQKAGTEMDVVVLRKKEKVTLKVTPK